MSDDPDDWPADASWWQVHRMLPAALAGLLAVAALVLLARWAF